MKKFTEEEIKRIAESMGVGLKCFYKIDTQELIDQFEYKPEDSEEDDFEPQNEFFEIDDDNYVPLHPMPSHESYKIMENFARSLDDEPFKNELFDALEKRKPFQHFKWLVEGSENHRTAWFNFKEAANLSYVKSEIAFQLDNLKDEEE